VPIEECRVEANGFTFTARRAGSAGEPILFLHGFFETSAMWLPLMARLAGDGYRCFAPDQRGYSPGARPAEVEDYRYEHLAADVLALADELGWDTFHLVGHDWGAIAGWATLAVDASRIRSWSALSVPHPEAFARAVWEDPDGAGYRAILEMFLAPDGFAEEMGSASDYAMFKAAWASSDDKEKDAYLAVLRQPGALTAALNWYRASDAHRRALNDTTVSFGPVGTPTLVLRGTSDPYIGSLAYQLAPVHMTGPYRVVDLDAGHWLVQDQPEQVHAEVLGHLRANPL
jgi:pimeloyl-ACP methyl ester carboxylesterase